MTGEPDDEALLFPSRRGTIRSPNNFGRTWREARGSDYAWVTAKTFRKTVATIIAEEIDVAAAGRQLGHRPGSKVTESNYIDRPTLAPDVTAVLDRLAANGGAIVGEDQI